MGAVDELFAQLDADASGTIDYRELNHLLRQGSAVELAAELRDGAQGAIETRAMNATALRGGVRDGGPRDGGPLREATVAAVRSELARGYHRVIDFFRVVDRDGDGAVTKHEFRASLPLLGFGAGGEGTIDCLFDSFDLNGDGSLTFEELDHMLRYEATRLKDDSAY